MSSINSPSDNELLKIVIYYSMTFVISFSGQHRFKFYLIYKKKNYISFCWHC